MKMTWRRLKRAKIWRNYSDDMEKLQLSLGKDMEKLQRELNKVYTNGFNIYQCLNCLKKDLGFAKDFCFPAEIITKVCEQYLKDRPKKSWPWFLKVFKSESEKYYADKNIEENDKSLSIDAKVRDLIKKITKGE